jgi:hypothetical protein
MSAAIYNAILYNASLYGGGSVVDPAEPTVAWSELLACLYPRLHAADASTLVWWTESDLRNWANEALQLLARQALLFIRRDTGTLTVSGQREYPLPQRHLATIHATYNDRPLLPTDRAQIDSLDYGADAAACLTGQFPKRWYEDTLGVHASVGVYPSPFDASTLAVIFSQAPEALTSTASTMPIPYCLAAFVEDYVLGEAWNHDSDFAMPELAQHFQQKRAFYLELYQAYWGPKQ